MSTKCPNHPQIPAVLCDCGDSKAKTKQPTSPVHVRWAHKDVAEEVQWLVHDFIPAHCLVLLTGREGEGKSTWAGRLHALATTGDLPGDFPAPMAVLVMGVEDSWSSRWIPRYHAYGADLARIGRDPGFITTDRDGKEHIDLLSLTDDDHLSKLGAACQREGVGILYLDHLSEALEAGINSNGYTEMGEALKRLNRFAMQYRVTVVCGWHLSKGAGAIRDKIMGSTAVRSSSRLVLTVASDPDTNLRFVAVTKSNDLPSDLPAKSFTITEATVAIDGKHFTTSVASQSVDADHPGTGREYIELLIEKASSGERPTDGDGQVVSPDKWLTGFLEQRGGSALKKEVVAYGDAVGLSESVLEKSSYRLQLHRRPRGRLIEWCLPSTDTTSAAVNYRDVADVADVTEHPPEPATSATSAKSATSATDTSGTNGRHVRDTPTVTPGGRRMTTAQDHPAGTRIDLDAVAASLNGTHP